MVGEYKVAALCTSRIYDLKVHGFIVSLNECLKKNGFLLWVFSLNEDIYWDEEKDPAEASVFEYVSYQYVDVLVLMNEKIKSHTISGRIINKAKEEGKPVVVLTSVESEISDKMKLRKIFAGVDEQMYMAKKSRKRGK